MRIAKKYIGRGAFIIELILFSGYYVMGANGIVSLVKLHREIVSAQAEVETAKEEVVYLQRHIAMQKKHPFFKEKIAREQLQLAHADEEIYVL